MNAKWICRISALMAAGIFGLAGCSGSSGGEETGTLNIGLTDGPVHKADAVVIEFAGLELKPAGGPPELFDFDPNLCDDPSTAGTCRVNLLELDGTNYTTIFQQSLPAGDYQWVRLLVNAEENVPDSYVMLKDGPMCSLYIPSAEKTGLKIVSGITVTANGRSDYMLDFDVRKSITAPGQLPPNGECAEDYILKPAIRIVDKTEVGSIAGTVDPSLVEGCRDEKPAEGVVDYLDVYVFEAFDDQGDPIGVTVDDYDGEGDPITSAMVDWNGTDYTYEVGYLLEGDYKLGLTCTPDSDVMPGEELILGQEDWIVDNYGCDFADPGCDAGDPPFNFIAERNDVSVVIDTLADGSFPPAP